MAGRALVRRASDYREGQWRSGRSEPTGPHSASGTRSSRKRPDTLSATASKSGFHMLQSPVTFEDDEDDHSPSEGIHIWSSDAEGTQAPEIHRKRDGQREEVQQTKMSPRVTLSQSRKVSLSEKTAPQPETREGPLQRTLSQGTL